MRFGCRPGTWDQAILGNVLNGEYGTIDFTGKIVLDVGAHIGAFSLLAAHHGASRVVACEAASENFALLRANCAPYPSIVCIHGAVWSSDDPHLPLRWRRNAHPENTGGGTVLPCEEIAGFRISDVQGEDVPRIAFDALVRDLGRVDLLKIDAEGSEYPILLRSAMLGRVGEIVGEYHALSGTTPGMSNPPRDWNIDRLSDHLRSSGFSVERSANETSGVFRARRPPFAA